MDEKIPYALDDLEALPMAGCIAYAGKGFSDGVLHMLERRPAPRTACRSPIRAKSTAETRELDHLLAMHFGWWDVLRRQEEAGFRRCVQHHFGRQLLARSAQTRFPLLTGAHLRAARRLRLSGTEDHDLVTNADDLTGLHDPKGVENLGMSGRSSFTRFVRATAITMAMPLARKFVETGGSDRP